VSCYHRPFFSLRGTVSAADELQSRYFESDDVMFSASRPHFQSSVRPSQVGLRDSSTTPLPPSPHLTSPRLASHCPGPFIIDRLPVSQLCLCTTVHLSGHLRRHVADPKYAVHQAHTTGVQRSCIAVVTVSENPHIMDPVHAAPRYGDGRPLDSARIARRPIDYRWTDGRTEARIGIVMWPTAAVSMPQGAMQTVTASPCMNRRADAKHSRTSKRVSEILFRCFRREQ